MKKARSHLFKIALLLLFNAFLHSKETSPCFAIKRIEMLDTSKSLNHNEILSALPFIQKLIDRDFQTCFNPQQIASLINELNLKSIEEGFITTKFGLLPQDLNTEMLKIGISIGRIRDFQIQEDRRHLLSQSKDFPIQSGDILNLKELEFGISNLKRLSYLSSNLSILPTPLENQSDIKLDLFSKSLPLFFQLSIDNAGNTGIKHYGDSPLHKLASFFTSNIQSSWILGIENPTLLGDTLSLYLNHSIPYGKNEHSLYTSMSYSLPIYRFLLELNGSFSHSASILKLNFLSPTYTIRAWNFESKLSYLFFANPSASFLLGLKWDIKDNQSFIDQTELEVQRKFLSDLSLFATYKYSFGVQDFQITFSLLQGIPIFGSNRLFGEDRPYLYTIPTLDFYLNSPFAIKDQSFNFSSLFKTQISQSDLFASEKMSIGGRASVRGFDGLMLSGQIGVLWRNDLVYYLPPLSKVTFAPSLGLDAGYVQDFKEKADRYNFLSGGGIGMKLFAPYFNMELWWYYPIFNPYQVQTQSIYFNLGIHL